MQAKTELEAIAARMAKRLPAGLTGRHATAIPGFQLVRRETAEEHCELYEPLIGLTAQCRKHTLVAGEDYRYGPGHCLIAGVDMPSKTTILSASPEEPFLALALDLDRELVARLSADGGAVAPGIPRGAAVMPAEAKVIRAFSRLLELLDEPEDIPVMAPLLVREIHHRLLLGPQGGWLRAICAGGAVVNRVAEAVRWIRANYKSPLAVPDLAKSVGMSESSLFRAFRELTGLSPLQFQKTLRLYEARRLIFTRASNVENAAYAVGYASATQFAREYKRLFGEAPKRDATRRQARAGAQASPP